ncbi:MAG TPA: hypothetical protein VEK84_16110 [Terriglobales bacterium]|nr:hypothetical protein [Terriglobales bacterium]
MKRALMVVVMCTAVLNAKNASRNRLGVLLRMESVPCGVAEASGFSKALLGAPTPAPMQDGRLCQEYVLRSEGLYYRIRSRDRKHPVLLPIGEQAQFHLHRDRMLLQVEDFDSKAYEFTVLAIVPENHGERLRQQPVENKDSSEPLQETLQ